LNNLSEQAKESRDKILKAAEELFSTKGFDGTSVREVAEKAGVNKALIFYYFKNKEEILQCLFNTLIHDMKQEAMKGLTQEKFKQLEQGNLVPDHDKLKFSNLSDDEIDRYMDAAILTSVEFYLERKNIIRILVAESLKRGSHSSLIFRATDLLTDKGAGSLSDVIEQNGVRLQIDNKALVDRFFTGLMPVFSFVIYFDQWKEHYQMSDEEFKEAFIKSFKTTYGNHYRF
jgi:TetR/AcrR family transcriptional regulator